MKERENQGKYKESESFNVVKDYKDVSITYKMSLIFFVLNIDEKPIEYMSNDSSSNVTWSKESLHWDIPLFSQGDSHNPQVELNSR